jgi:hypothetical protein
MILHNGCTFALAEVRCRQLLLLQHLYNITNLYHGTTIRATGGGGTPAYHMSCASLMFHGCHCFQ